MLICMAWHRHLASRYGDSTFSSCFCSPLVSLFFFFLGGFHRSSRSKGGKQLYRHGGFGMILNNTDDIPLAGAIRLEIDGKGEKSK